MEKLGTANAIERGKSENLTHQLTKYRTTKIMKNEKITYRGASFEQDARTPQLQQKQQTKTVEYRGAKGEVQVGHKCHKETVTYRGATGEVQL